MPKKQQRPPKGRLLEKAARGPQAFQVRYERIISKYVSDVAGLNSEAARSHRFSQLLHELFSDVEAPVITDYLSGLETSISAQEAAKCRVSRGRPDALFGNIVVEFEKSFPARLREAKRQLQNYIAILRASDSYRDVYFIPIASDGLSFRVFAPKEEAAPNEEGVALDEIESFDARTKAPIDFYYWLDRYFCRRIQREPKADNFVRDFGLNSPAFRQSSALWSQEAQRVKEHSDFKVIYDNWRKYLGITYGTAVGDESLFIRHTFLATLAKLIAYLRLSGSAAAPGERETQEILQGTYFEKQGILNFLEEDFFSWVGRGCPIRGFCVWGFWFLDFQFRHSGRRQQHHPRPEDRRRITAFAHGTCRGASVYPEERRARPEPCRFVKTDWGGPSPEAPSPILFCPPGELSS